MNNFARWLATASVTSMVLFLGGCALWEGGTSTQSSSSLVEFLYPDNKVPPPSDAIPELRIPLRVGLAFLPSKYVGANTQLLAAQKEQLLETVKQRFAERKFVADITVIPDYYLANKNGFEGLAGVQRLYNVDVMALVSYDQVMHLEDNDWSLGYLTIVGAYVLKGSRHDVSTLVDLAVVDPASRSLILRAGGTDTRHGNTTLVDKDREARESSATAFIAATTQMIEHFDSALTKFEADVRAGKANVHVVNRHSTPPLAGGGGALQSVWLLLLLPPLTLALRRQKRGARLRHKSVRRRSERGYWHR